MREIRPIYSFLGIIWCMLFTVELYGAGSVLKIKDATVTEGDIGTTDMNFTVYHTIKAHSPVTVYYSTIDDTAKAGTDYIAKTGTVTIPPDEQTTTIVIPVINDLKLTKNNKMFKVNIASAYTVSKPIAIGTILDNDTQPTNNAADKNPFETKGESHEIRK